MATYVIVGDGVAGHTAAETIRTNDPDATIHVFTDEAVPFYDRIGLRDYVRDGRDRDALLLKGVEWYGEHDIQLHLDTRITWIDRSAQEVHTTDDTYVYDALLLATGSTPRPLPMESGISAIHHLWYLEQDADPMRADLMRADHGIAIGGGLLGFDIAGALAKTDTETHYLIREENWWSSVLDVAGATLVHDAMEDHGVHLHLHEEVETITADDRVQVSTNQDTYTTDVIGVAIGNTPNIGLADDAGLSTDDGIVVDEHLQTGDQHIFAAGDCVAYTDIVLGKRHRAGSWVTAQAQGEQAGKNMVNAVTGQPLEPFEHVDMYTVAHFGLHIASLGDPTHADGQTVHTVFDEENKRYRKVVIEDDRIVGAAIIGEMRWLTPLKELIKRNVDISDQTDALNSAETDLKTLL